MMTSSKAGGFVLSTVVAAAACACAVPHAAWRPSTSELPPQELAFAKTLAIGDIVGAEFDPNVNRLSLLASPPTSRQETVISSDDVVTMARAVFTSGTFGFSLELERAGRSLFRSADLVDPARLATRLHQAADPVSAYLRTHLSRGAEALLAEYVRSVTPGRELAKLRPSFVETLNRALDDSELYDPRRFVGVEIGEETRDLLDRHPTGAARRRLHRMLLEDAFPLELRVDLEPHYRVRYLPATLDVVLSPILNHTSVEATFLTTDRALKDLSRCHPRMRNIPIGACESWLSAEAAERALKANEALATSGNQVVFFDLSVNPRFEGPGLVWFDRPRLTVVAAARNPRAEPTRASQIFARNVTAHIDALVSDPTLGPEFRRLEALLLLARTFGWAQQLGARADTERLSSFHVRPIDVDRVPLEDDRVVLTDPLSPLRPRALLLRGGIRIRGGETRSPETTQSAPAQKRARTPPPLLRAQSLSLRGMHLIRIDLTDAVGLIRSPI